MSINNLLISDEILKERSIIHGNTDPKLIYPDIKTAQDMFIVPILGTALFNKLQTIIGDSTIVTNAALIDYKNLLDNYIIDTLIYYTMAELPMSISYQFWNKGIIRKQGENTETPSMSELIDISNRYRQRAEYYANRLMMYLRQTATSTKLPEYLLPGTGRDTIHPDHEGFTMPVYLGGNDYCSDTPNTPYNG